MAKVYYGTPTNIRERLLELSLYRHKLCLLQANYRYSSPEYRRLSEATAALDDVCALLAGDRELLWPQLSTSGQL